ARRAARRNPTAPLGGSRSEVLVHDRNASAGFGLAAPRARAGPLPLPHAVASPPLALARVGDRRDRGGAPRRWLADASAPTDGVVLGNRAAPGPGRPHQRGARGGPRAAGPAGDAPGARRAGAELRARVDPRRRRRAGLARGARQPRREVRAAAGA